MTAVGRSNSSRGVLPAGVPVQVAVEPVCLVVRWAISADAWRAARPDPALDPKTDEVWMEWTIALLPGANPAARCEVVDPITAARAVLVVVAPSRDDLHTPVRWRADEDLRHVAVEDMLHVTIRAESGTGPGDAARVLYARTTMLARLGLPGGRYEVAGASWVKSNRPEQAARA